MRERLIAAFVGLTIAVVALYGVPRAYIVAEQVQLNEERKVERSLDLLVALLEERTDNSAVITEEYLSEFLNEAERIEYVAPDGVTTVAAGVVLSGDERDIARTSAVADGGSVTLARAGEFIQRRVTEAVLPVIFTGVGLVLVSMLCGFWLARRLSRPFRELAHAAGELGSGSFDVEVPRYRVPEADEIAHALRSSRDSLRELVRREQEFAANASHQLRTPLTALRLELEDLSMWPETPTAVAESLEGALRELDRISATVTELLAVARGQRLASVAEVDLCTLARDAAQRWEVSVRAAKRKLSVRVPPRPIRALVPCGPVHQVLDVLIDNALRHGRGTITLAVEDEASYIEISVADSGERPPDGRIFARSVRGGSSEGEGIGLSVAQDLAAALDGHLLLAEQPSTRFRFLLPVSAASPPEQREA
jgi:signal transduction histidine kinase